MKILIVDDEDISRKILQKKLGKVGECTTADSSKKALELFNAAILDKEPFDLITLDVSMPKMNGKQLLMTLRQKEKKLNIPKEKTAKILIITSRMRTATIKDCIKLGCSGYLLKPVNTITLMENLQSLELIDIDNIDIEDDKTDSKIVAQVIENFYSGKIRLPSLPNIAEQIQDAASGEDPTIDDLADIIKNDIALTGKLVSIANSPFYQGVEKAENLNTALIRFGIKTTVSLVSAIMTRKLFKTDNDKLAPNLEKLWMHSFACGIAAKHIAEECNYTNPDNAFLIGIMHDIGILLLLNAISDIHPNEDFSGESIRTALYEIHTTFGAALLRKMNFSNEIIRTTEFHHWNDFSEKESKSLPIIYLADRIADHIGYSYLNIKTESEIHEGKENQPKGLINSLERLGLELENIQKIAEKIKPIVAESAQSFG